MARRKPSRQSPSHHANNNRSSSRSHPSTPQNGRRGNAQRMLLLGQDFGLSMYNNPGPSRGHHNFTLAQEARNTEEHFYRQHGDRKLRQMGITFVSPQDPQDPESQIGSQQPSTSPSSEETPSNPTQSPPINTSVTTLAPATSSELNSSSVDSQSVAAAPETMKIERPVTPPRRSTTDVSSPGEEVVFVPRNRRRNPTAQAEQQKQPSKTVLEQVVVQSNIMMTKSSANIDKPFGPRKLDFELQSTNAGQSTSKNQKKTRRGAKYTEDEEIDDEADAIMNDYIRNLQENGEAVDDLFSLRLLGNQLPDVDSDEHHLPSNNPQAPDEEASSDTSSTKSDEDGLEWSVHTAVVTGKRYGDSGVEYLFKPAGSTLEEAIWLGGADMTHEIQHLIDHFEAGLGDIDMPGWNETQDETLAMLLQQEEEDTEDEGFDLDDMIKMMNGKQNKRGIFPNASKLADAYDDFDIMDRERASLAGPSKRKSRKCNIGQIPPQFLANQEMDEEEYEIHAQLDRFIASDRERKRIRKQEREELRQAGLLGNNKASKPGSMDIKSFAPHSSPLSQVHSLVTSFLMNGFADRLTLPPMSKADRVHIHMIASKFNLSSKSQGKGDGRFPVLNKTKRTTVYEGDEPAIARTLDSLARRFARNRSFGGNFPVPRHGGGPGGGRGGGSGGGGGGGGIIHNRDGMIVGTGAAEIGQGNKGYEMLARMGWTTGTGLGSNRSGILDPVQAIVKNSRTGLG
ncbi:hypothetical protein TWF696_000724 [Orbilia brochopaga]|uniref:Protein SQS1 n=1 Tax=Orbilia brochopaga TaxID=3140254 RepID=A0AAV9VFP7_9PEZI